MDEPAAQTPPSRDASLPPWRRPGLAWAVVVGLLAALLGVLLEWSGWRLTDRWLSPLALVTGVLVGLGVRQGSGARGGWFYQGLAVVLAYLAIVAGHLPAFDAADLRSMASSGGSPLVLFLLTLPFFRGLNGVFDLALIVLGLLQAAYWNRKPRRLAAGSSRQAGPPAAA